MRFSVYENLVMISVLVDFNGFFIVKYLSVFKI